MSNFIKKTRNPKTGELEDATYLDDFYGTHVYGVRFPDGSMYREEDLEEWKEPIYQNRTVEKYNAMEKYLVHDEKPLFSQAHRKTSDEWDFKVPYIGKWGNRLLDWIWFKVHRPKLSEDNFENHEKRF